MRALRTLAIVGLAALAPVVHASPIVTQWNYLVSSIFDTASTVFTTIPPNAVGQGPTTNTNTLLAWGNTAPAVQSQLRIEGGDASSPAAAPLVTTIGPVGTIPSFGLGQIAPTQTFVHQNFTIPLDSFVLDSVDVQTTLTLNPFVPDNPAFPAFPPLTFNINFLETPNGGPCPAGSTPCPDIFVIGGALDNFSFWYNSTTGVLSPFNPADPEFNQYFVQIFPFPPGSNTALNTLSPAACLAAGAAVGCQGFITAEGQQNFVQFAFAITTNPILEAPEPGTLALFALALVGLGYSFRRRQA